MVHNLNTKAPMNGTHMDTDAETSSMDDKMPEVSAPKQILKI